jgi:hypothetical protein
MQVFLAALFLAIDFHDKELGINFHARFKIGKRYRGAAAFAINYDPLLQLILILIEDQDELASNGALAIFEENGCDAIGLFKAHDIRFPQEINFWRNDQSQGRG